MEVRKSEDSLIFCGITPGTIKMNRIYDAFSVFMKDKKEVDGSDRFNFIIFQNHGPSYLDHFTFDPKYIIKSLKSSEKRIVKANIAGGIFVAITFIIDVFKKISDKVFRLIILTDDGAYKIPYQYITILEDLIDKVKDMPFFIDVIRLNSFDLQEKGNLRKLAQQTKGKLHDINDIKELNSVFSSLSKKKLVQVPGYYGKKNAKTIPERNIPFYANLADDPTEYKGKGTCAICFQGGNNEMIKCPSCDIIIHKRCGAQWAKMSSIGISYVFRCHNCFNLLKLEQQFVFDVQTGRIPAEKRPEKFTHRDMINYLRELEEKRKPKIIQVNDPMVIEEEPIEEKSNKKNKKKIKKKIKMIICPNCSHLTTSINKECPKCFYYLQ
ncbi:MAG: hypothetical protein KGD63_04125 [Candidatus Lokiarchaeota archaeon]|nr:hypothetical protein [Candidatus Lokiarchaeota archaeon]